MPKGVTYNQTQADQAEAIADALNKSGGITVTGGGDANAVNQQSQITLEEAIRDRIIPPLMA